MEDRRSTKAETKEGRCGMAGRAAEKTKRGKKWTHCTTVEWDAKRGPDRVDGRAREM